MEKEVAKLVGKKAELEKQIEKLSEKISKGDYKEKVPIKVQEQDAEKVGTGNKHLTGLQVTKPLSSWVFFSSPPFDSQLRQSQIELEKVKEATDNFKKMM